MNCKISIKLLTAIIIIILLFTVSCTVSENELEIPKKSSHEKLTNTDELEIPEEPNHGESIDADEEEMDISQDVVILNPEGTIIQERIQPPNGFVRIDAEEYSFAYYLRNLPLKAHGAKVQYYDGRTKSSRVYEAVIDMDIGDRDLQQCADAVMRLRAEYLYAQERFDEIHFNFTNGFRADYNKWMEGYRIDVDGNKVSWVKRADRSNDYESFRKYLNMVFAYAGTLSLSQEMVSVPIEEMRIGDVFIQGGSPGHCVIVVDIAQNKETGEKLFLLAQSYMPAQDIHVLKNMQNEEISPWYSLDFGDVLKTPEWTFSKDDLKRFEGESMNNNNINGDGIAESIFDKMAEMSMEEKIGQMVIVGLDGYSIDSNARKMIEEYRVGGFILYKKNIKNAQQLVSLTNSLKAANSGNKIPLFISVDEEGGQITRMPEGVKKIPSSGELGEINNEEICFEIGTLLGYELNIFGYNMNFAPVLDINSNPENPVIGMRAFGQDEEIVSRLGIQTMKGIQSKGVISVVKHFPGHGDTSVDSHIGLPKVNYDLDRLRDFELVPFIRAVDNGADAIMVAHILFPEIDPENPATLSKAIITDILKEEMGFEGVVVTDDMTMGAIMENYDIGEAVVKSILAGSDIILVCHEHENEVEAINAIRKAVEEGLISEDRINESVYKILKIKDKYDINDKPVEIPDIEELNKKIDEILKMAS